MTSSTAAPEARMPAAFLGHGTPMNAIDRNRYTEAWRAFGARVPRPRAILMISAHWYINASAVTAMEQPRTIHDFYGFPEELFAVEYPARGDPALAGEITELVKPTWVGQDRDSWGIDHGAWSVLVHAFPSADIPVVQLSANALKPFDYHLELGAKLAPLREQGVLVLASGNIVHNLGRMDWTQPDTGYPWVRSFDDSAREVMTADPAGVPELQAHQYFSAAVPTPDHFIPLLYLAGLAASDGKATEVLVDGYAMGSLSMTAYTLGCERIVYDGVGGAPVLPKIPPDESNICLPTGQDARWQMVRSPSLARPRSVGRQPQSGPGRAVASGMITHCQIMGQEPRIALTDSWLSLLFASAEIVLLCAT